MPRDNIAPASSSSSQFVPSSSSASASASASSSSYSYASSSASASASSSTRSSPANDLFRISLPDSSPVSHDLSLPPDIDLTGTQTWAAAYKRRLAQAGQARFQEVLEDASRDLKARLANGEVGGEMSERKKRRMFEEFLREMSEFAELQEREVEERARHEAHFARTMLLSKSDGPVAGPSGLNGSSSARGAGPSSGASSSGFSTASTSTSTFGSSMASSHNVMTSQATEDDSDGSSTEEETDRPTSRGKKAHTSTNGTLLLIISF